MERYAEPIVAVVATIAPLNLSVSAEIRQAKIVDFVNIPRKQEIFS